MKFRKLLSALLAMAIVSGCVIFTSTATVTSSDFTAEELDSSSYDIRKYTDPFWEGNIVYNEIVHPIRDKGGNLLPFELMYDATEIVSVKNYELDVTYKEGTDYMLIGGNLYILGTGNIPVMDYYDMHPVKVPNGYGEDEFRPYYPHADTKGQWEYWTGGSDVCEWSLAVTYIHNDAWEGPVPESQESRLPNTFDKLKNKEELTIVVAGDSVATGAMSSGFLGMSPYADAYPEMTKKALRAKYGNNNINLINSAIGGTMSDFDETKMNNTIITHEPDLVIINFGMNDSSCDRIGIPGEKFHDNLALQIEYINEKLPDCEVLLLSSLYGNRYTFPAEKYEEHAAVLHTLAEEYEGVGVADPQVIEKYLIEEVGKDYICFTADNMVHPGDLGMRLYTQAILEALSMTDIDVYKEYIIDEMTAYADLDSHGEDKKQELLEFIANTKAAIADLDEEWDINEIVDAAYIEMEKIIIRCDVHTYVDTVIKPTCKAGGYTHSVCSVCSYEYDHDATPDLGGEHVMDSGRQTVIPTYLTPGEMTYSCARCPYTETESLPVLTNAPVLSGKGMMHISDSNNYMASDIKPYTNGSGYVEFDLCPLNIEDYDGIPYVGVWFCSYAVTACYNFRAQQVQIVETNLPFAAGKVHASVDYEWGTDSGKYEHNWKKFAVHLNGTTVRIYIDGELILEDTKSFYRASSEVALVYSNGECYMDNFKIARGNYDPTTGTGGTVLGEWDFNSTSSYNSFFNSWGQQYAKITYEKATAANVTTAHYKHTTHSGALVGTVASDCANGGYGEYACDMCGYVYFDKYTDPLYEEGHTLVNRTVTVEPTRTDTGECTYECANCDMTFTEILPADPNAPIEYFAGDVNGDGRINNSDVLTLQKLLRTAPQVSYVFEGADVNGDGTISNSDYLQLAKVLKGVSA